MLSFKERFQISGVGLRRADGEGWPAKVNLLCWDETNRAWVHIAHLCPSKPSAWNTTKQLIPRVTTSALLFRLANESEDTKLLALCQLLVYSE